MVTKEYCESRGMEFVRSHKDGKGGWVRAYCRKWTDSEKFIQKSELKNFVEAEYRKALDHAREEREKRLNEIERE